MPTPDAAGPGREVWVVQLLWHDDSWRDCGMWKPFSSERAARARITEYRKFGTNHVPMCVSGPRTVPANTCTEDHPQPGAHAP